MPDKTSSDPAKKTGAKKSGLEQFYPVNFADIQARNARMFARANEIMVRTAKAVWEKETELFKLDAEQSRGALAPFKSDGNPMAAFFQFFDRWHDYTEKSITNFREVNDLVRDCEWQMLDLVNENVSALRQHEAAE